MKVLKGEVMDLTKVCKTFPDVERTLDNIHNYLLREHLLETIDTLFNDGVQLVGLAGREGIGKTVLLIQYAKKYCNNVLSIFITPTEKWGYDPSFIRYDICNQINWLIKKENIKENYQDIEEGYFRNSLINLMNFKKSNDFYYFLIDGIETIPSDGLQFRDIILDMLPIGLSNFRFLITGHPQEILGNKYKHIRCEPFVIPGFSLDETIKYFKDYKIDNNYIIEIHKACRHIPGCLASIKRILHSGTDIDTLINNLPNELNDFYEMEWLDVNQGNKNQNHLLAIIAHDRNRTHNIDELSRMLKINSNNAKTQLNKLGFVMVDKETGEVSFVCEAFRRFAAHKLYDLKDMVNDLLIDSLIRKPQSDNALLYLPGYLEQAGRKEEIIDYLTPDNFAEMIKRSESVTLLQQKAELGVNTARDLCQDGPLLRFSIQRSAIKQLNGLEVLRSEIEAIISRNEFDMAIALGQTAFLKEDRLQLLAIIAKEQRSRGLTPKRELIEQIKILYNDIDWTQLGERAIEIAADLVHSSPELAIEMVEKSANSDEGENALDWAFAKLSIAALNAKDNSGSGAVNSIFSRIKDPDTRKFSKEIELLFGNHSAEELLKEVEQLDNTNEKLVFLRKWLTINERRNDAYLVSKYGIRLLLKTTEYSPNALVFKELALSLPYISDVDEAKHLIGVFDSQRSNIERYGPTEDYIGLQLILAETERKYNQKAANNRVMDIYWSINSISDLSIKASCMAILLCSLDRLDPTKQLEQHEGLSSVVYDDLKKDIDLLINSTADHYLTTKSIIVSLAKNNVELALEIINKLNLEIRRDKMKLELIEEILNNTIKEIDFNLIEQIIEEINDEDIKEEAVISLIDRLVDENKEKNIAISYIIKFYNKISYLSDLEAKCRLYCYIYIRLKALNEFGKLANNILKLLRSSWENIDVGCKKIDIGFKIVKLFADSSSDHANEYIRLIEETRNEICFESKTPLSTYITCLKLCIRAYKGLIPRRLYQDEDIENIKELITNIPSRAIRVLLWSEFALNNYLCNDTTQCVNIVRLYIRPLLESLEKTDPKLLDDLIVAVAPALYSAHINTAFETIDRLNINKKNIAYARICSFILKKCLPSDPYEEIDGQAYKNLTYEDIIDICEILRKIDDDSTIYHFIHKICDTLYVYRNKKFSQNQKNDIEKHLLEIIEDKFPDKRNISHDGYKIAARARVYRFVKTVRPKDWIELIERTEQIPNISDKAFVFFILAISMPQKEKRRELTFEKAKKYCDEIPSLIDRISRYEEFAGMTFSIDPKISKYYMRKAMLQTDKSDKPETYRIQRKVIDMAHKMDPELAGSLASLIDDDEARLAKKRLKKQIEILDMKKSIISNRNMKEEIRNESLLNYPKISWMLLGSLNAQRISTIHMDRARDLAKISSMFEIGKSYPILAWIIENIVTRHGETDQAFEYIRPMFDASIIGAKFINKLAQRSFSLMRQTRSYNVTSKNTDSIIIRPGERERAIQIIEEWIKDSVKDFLKICDPYFGLQDLEVLQMISSQTPNIRVDVLSSQHQQKQENVSPPYSNAYKDYWRLKISDQDPPYTVINIIGSHSTGGFPIHDRWWITNGSGLSLGTSYKSIGADQVSEIRILSHEEALEKEKEIDRYLYREIREIGGERIDFVAFTM
jgi:hypothetical protein